MLAAGFAAALIGAACGPEEPEEPSPGVEMEAPTEEPGEAGQEPSEPDEAEGEPAEGPETETSETGSAEDPRTTEETDEAPDDETEPIEGEETTEASDDGEFGVVAVTDVRVGSHTGFDRVVFEIEGDGLAGWDVRYVDEATSQGSGEEVEVAGDAVLAVALHNVTLPPDLPSDIEIWDGDRLEGPIDGVIAEVVNDTIFEGIQLIFVGLDEERAFVIERFEDPQRVVIDIPHGP